MSDKQMQTSKSILGQVRDEGYREGLGQASQVKWDEAYHEGWKQGRKDGPPVQWFVWGALIGAVMGYLTGLFVS